MPITSNNPRYKLFKVFGDIKRRCRNKNFKKYKDYGGRGVQCEWLSFKEFEADMASSFRPGLEIDRIDNNGNYSKANCRWATRLEQCNNQRTNRLLTYGGITQTLAQWARALGIKYSTLSTRFYCYKWPVEKCLTFKR